MNPLKLTASRGHLNHGLAIGGIIASAVPIIAVAATAGFAAVGLPLWIALGGAFSALVAGNVEIKSPLLRALEREHRKAGRSDG
jgi:hypothetical protein